MKVKIDVQFPPTHTVCDDDTFTSAIANNRTGHLLPERWEDRMLRPLSVHGAVGAYMAGMKCPSGDRLVDLVHDISDIEEWEKAAVRELFAQLSPVECREFMITTDASPREMARLMRECGVTRAVVVNWVNQYSNSWKDDTMLCIIYGERAAGRYNIPKVKN